MFEKLDYVYSVYKEGSFTAAAERLFISQPSLSAAIKKLEGELGSPLFERGSGGVKLTEVGEEYIRAAERIMDIREEFSNRLNDINELNIGHIIVGGTNYLSSYLLPRIINRFAERYPNVEVTLVEANSSKMGEMLKAGEIDIIIDSFDENFDEYEVYPLTNEAILVCVPKDREINRELEAYAVNASRLASGNSDALNVESIPVELFRDENFILLKSGNDMYYRAMRFFDEAKIMPRVSFYVDQLNISYALAESGMGLCFATDTLFRFGAPCDKLRLYKASGEHSSRLLYVAHKKNKYCTKAMRAFIETAKAEFS